MAETIVASPREIDSEWRYAPRPKRIAEAAHTNGWAPEYDSAPDASTLMVTDRVPRRDSKLEEFRLTGEKDRYRGHPPCRICPSGLIWGEGGRIYGAIYGDEQVSEAKIRAESYSRSIVLER